ncbi:MAG: hypothetical protein AB7V00_03210 [Bacilli bacterium]
MDIQWFSKNLQGYVSIYETNITLNTVASSYFKTAFTTLIGYDKIKNVLLIKALNKEEATMGKYTDNDLHAISIKQTYGRINGKSIISNIQKFFPLDFTKKNLYKFPCDWDNSQKFLRVYFDKEVN